MNVSEIKALLAEHGLRPHKGLGQNFLVDPIHLDRIADAAELSPDDLVLEIGPGLGALTERLVARAGQVVAVELDAGLAALLRERFAEVGNFHLVHADILEVEIPALLAPFTPPGEPLRYKVVANLPYYITSAALRHILESTPQPERVVVLVQREVAQRITARPGDLSLLAVSVQFYGKPEIIERVPAGAFYPAPKVDSAILRIIPYGEPGASPRPAVEVDDPDAFFEVVKAGFGQKRKQLKNALTAGLKLPGKRVEAALHLAGIDPRRRAETLSLEEWGRLTAAMKEER